MGQTKRCYPPTVVRNSSLPTRLLFSGHPGLRLRAEGAAAAAAEAHDPPAGARGHPHPVPVEVLRRRRELLLGGHLEDTPDPAAVAAPVSSTSVQGAFRMPTDSLPTHLISHVSARTNLEVGVSSVDLVVTRDAQFGECLRTTYVHRYSIHVRTYMISIMGTRTFF